MAESTPGTDVPAIHVRGLAYAYRDRMALHNVSFEVRRGSIHGFVGPNGAGKTTTLRILATLLATYPRHVHVLGHDVATQYRHVRGRIGYMPDSPSMYRRMAVLEYLDFFATAYGLRGAERDRTIEDVLALTDMGARKDNLIQSLSRGMLQRVALARTLVHDPELLLLDEPAAGLDPRARIELMEILVELGRMGKTIFISSHILAELSSLCDSVTIIDRGRIKYTGTLEGLLSEDGESVAYVLTLATENAGIEAALAGTAGVTAVERLEEELVYRVTFQKDQLGTNDILQVAIGSRASIAAFERDKRQLDEAFMALTDPGVSA